MPNLYLVTNPVPVVHSSGTVVAATVSLGYDVAHTDVEKLLCSAAHKANLQDPCVQIADLGDYSVTYRVAGFLAEVKYLISVRSSLRAQVLDALHGGGVEIVSPAFMNQRQIPADRQFIPRRHWPKPTTEEATLPEEKIFDKAEEAESRQQQATELDAVEARIKEHEKELAEASNPLERDDHERALKVERARRSELLDALGTEKGTAE